jgi:ABC-2 type transport system permease protein
MHKIWAVIRREFVERVRQRRFWIMAFVGPLLLGGVIGYQILMARGGSAKHIAVVDGTGSEVGVRLTQLLDSGKAFQTVRVTPGPRVIDSLTAEVDAKRLDGFLIITPDLIQTGKAEYRGSNVSSLQSMEALELSLNRGVVRARLEAAGVSPAVVAQAQIRIDLTTKKIAGGKTTEESSGESFILAYLMALLLFITILTYGANVMSSVLEEKTTRIVEVLVSSIKPFQLLLGKLLGVGAVSIFQFLIWGVSGRLLLSQKQALMSRMGTTDAGGFQLPHLPPATIAIFLAFFVGGFLLYSAMFAAVGAMSSNEQEARQAQQPVVYMLMLSYLSIVGLTNDPNSILAVSLSLIPFTSPIAMPVRWTAGNLPLSNVLLSLGLLAVGILIITWIASRIYSVGILMTGKRPSIKELLQWVRTA